MQVFDLPLRLVGAAHCIAVKKNKAAHQGDHEQPKLPIDEQCQRQHHDNGEQSREVVAQKAQPDKEQAGAAGMHNAQHPSSVMLAVEGQRQSQSMFEERCYDGQTAPMREPIGMQRHPNTRNNSKNAVSGPVRNESPNHPV